MAAAVRSCMDEKIRAFAYDNALSQASEGTADETVNLLRQLRWLYYDDVVDHKVTATRELWDWYNRLLLLLDSDAEIGSTETTWDRQPHQLAAAGLLLGWSLLTAYLEWDPQLLVSGLPFGPLAMVFDAIDERRRQREEPSLRELAMTPFGSVAALRAVRHLVPHFRRRRYPSHLRTRHVHGILDTAVPEWVLWGPRTALRCLFSPAVLTRQLWTSTGSQLHLYVVVPEDPPPT